MRNIAALAEEALLAAVLTEKVLMPGKSRAGQGLAVVTVLFTGAAIIFFATALNRYLNTIYPADQAALIMGGAILWAAFITGLLALYVGRKRSGHASHMASQVTSNIRELAHSLYTELDEPIRDNPKAAIALAALAGFFVAGPRLRL